MFIVSEIFSCPSQNADHQCDEKGGLLILDDYSTVRDTPENKEKYKDRERGWTVACSICAISRFHMDVHG